jgi:hypothetical protein
MNVMARLKALERQRQASNRRMRVLVGVYGRPLNLANSTCRRTLAPNGLLTEIVELDGIPEDLADGELETFIQRFPIETSAREKAR